MVSSGVAEPDVRLAATLLRCALHLHTAAREVRPRRSGCSGRQVCLLTTACAHTASLHCVPTACPAELPLQLRLPCGAPVDLCLSLASGEAYSGLLGTASLTYQVGFPS